MAGLRLFWPRGRSGLREGPPGLGGRSSRGIAPFGMFPRAGDLLLGGGSNLGGTYGSNLPAVSYMLLGSGEVAGLSSGGGVTDNSGDMLMMFRDVRTGANSVALKL